MLEKLTLAVIMINYKTPKLAINAADSLLPELKGMKAKVIIVDNCSGDNSLQMIADWIEVHRCSTQVELLESPGNLGFSGGNNYGIKAVDADYYLLLNSDTIVRKGAVGKLMDMTMQFPDAGLFSPRLEWEDGQAQESCFNFHHPVCEIIRSVIIS